MRWGEIRQTKGIDLHYLCAGHGRITSFGHVYRSVKSATSRQLFGIGPSTCGDHALHTATARQAQPVRNANPPNGVIAPGHFNPVQLKR